MDHST